MDRDGEVLANIDAAVLGRTMLDAARAARIGVTLSIIGPPKPRNVYVSEVAAEILGWSVEELLERDPETNVAPEDVPRLRERYARRVRGEIGQTSYEMLVVRKDGKRVPVEVTASDVTIDGKRAVFAFLVDVSERKAVHDQHTRNEARFRDLIERAPEPIGIVREGRFVYANHACLSAFGCAEPEHLYATTINSFLSQEDGAVRDARETVLLRRERPPGAHTYRVHRRDGSIVLLEVTAVHFEYEGKLSVLTIARDVTARRRLEMQLVQAERLAALGTMAAGVAHEINNPLAYVMLNLEWIARKLPAAQSDPGAIARLLEVIEEARHGAQRVSDIVRELRSFSRADGETRRRVDLGGVVQSAIKLTGHEIRHRARVLTSLESVRPIWANEAQLEQVVINLLMNAAQAAPETRLDQNEIRISVRPGADGSAILEVMDNGHGIPPEVLPRIFDPFFTTKPFGVGTGLGLSICHGIVTALGGRISVSSEPTSGATFLVVLPTMDAIEAGATAPPSEPTETVGGRRARILVVDDELPIVTTLRALLGQEHEVLVATSGQAALAALQAGPEFDVIFCDLMMPGTTGIEVYERLRSNQPGMEERIVFMTGGAFTARATEFLAKVGNRRLEKPFSLQLVERIAREATMVARRTRSDGQASLAAPRNAD